MQNILFWLTEKYYLIECRVGNFINLRNGHDKNFAPKQNERDCPMTNGLKCRKPVFMRASGICFIKWL